MSLIAADILPVSIQHEDSDTSSTESEESPGQEAVVIDKPSPVPAVIEKTIPVPAIKKQGAVPIVKETMNGGAIVPKAMPAEQSPHPRAMQEQRFVEIAKLWHSWVVVPERIAGVPTTTEMLDSGVYLPQKHCFWKDCDWIGTTNTERWAHAPGFIVMADVLESDPCLCKKCLSDLHASHSSTVSCLQ